MRNVWRIFTDDLRLARSSIVSVLVMLTLCLVPAVIAWFGIAGNWNPNANSAQLKVAVSNSDDGYESSLMPVRLNIGDRVVNTLRSNDAYDWTFVSERDALEGLRSGEYYAAITIPREFSSEMMAAFSSASGEANVGFNLNLKENPVASILGNAGPSELEEGIRTQFTNAVDEMALGLASDLVSYAGGNNAREFGARLVSHLDAAANDLDQTADEVRAFAGLMGATSSLATAATESLGDAQAVVKSSDETVENASEVLTAAIGLAQSAANDIESQVKAAKSEGGRGSIGTEKATKLASDVKTLAGQVDTIARESNTVAESLDKALKSLSGDTKSVVANLESARDQLGIAANKLNASSAKIRKFQDDVATAIARGDLGEVATIVSGAKTTLAQWLAEPVKVERRALSSAENYGSSQAPFFTVLSLWIGALLMVLFLKTGVSENRLQRYEEAGIPMKGYQRYLGRALVFVMLALTQATVMAAGNLLFLEVPCANPLLYFIACWVSALAFSCLAYTLVESFGGMGAVVCLFLLIVQLVGLGGEFPTGMMGYAFQALDPVLPFAHAAHSLKAAAAGVYGMEYAFDLLIVGAYLLGALVVGLALRRPLERASAYVSETLEDTGLM